MSRLLKIVENLWAVGALPRTMQASIERSTDPLAGGRRLAAPSPRTPTSALGLWPRFSPRRSHSAVSPNSLHFPSNT